MGGVAEQLKNKMEPERGKPGSDEPAKKEKKEKNPIPVTFAGMDSQKIEGVLQLYKPMLANVLMGAIPPERMIQISTRIIADNDDLKACSTRSIIGAVLSAALIRLDPTPELGLVSFIPRKGKCCFDIGYQGWVALILRNPAVSHIYAYAVREGDKFEVRLGLEPNIIHVPNLDKPGDLKYVYAVAHLTNGQTLFRYLNKAQVEARRDRSEARDSKYSPWNHPVLREEMWAKTALKVIRKFIPVDPESKVSTALAVDERSIMPEAFDLETKTVKMQGNVDDVNFTDVPEGNGNGDKKSGEGPADGQSATSQENGAGNPGKSAPDERYLKALEVHRQKIIELKGEKFWNDLPGQFGLESFTEVPAADQEQTLLDLSKITNEALRANQRAQNGQQGSIL
jgi:recombination protein RecT